MNQAQRENDFEGLWAKEALHFKIEGVLTNCSTSSLQMPGSTL